MGSITESANSSNGTLHALEQVQTTGGPSCRSQGMMHGPSRADSEQSQTSSDGSGHPRAFATPPSRPTSLSGLSPSARSSSRLHNGAASSTIPIGTALCAGVANLASHILEVNTAPEQLALAAEASPVRRRAPRGRGSRRPRTAKTGTEAGDLVVPDRRSSLTLSLQEAADLAKGVLGLTGAEVAPARLGTSQAHAATGTIEDGIPLTIDTNVPSEIGRTLSTSTAGTEQSGTVESSGTAATSETSSSTSKSTSTDQSEVKDDPVPAVGAEATSGAEQSGVASRGFPSPSEDRLDPSVSTAQSAPSFAKMRRLHALHELVETERSYAEDLGLLVDVFFCNLSDQPFFAERSDRVETVQRNATELLVLHREMAENMERILEEHSVSATDLMHHASGMHLAVSAEAEAATHRIAKYFGKLGPRFAIYKNFCSRHGEALQLVRDAERRHGGDDWRAYERACTNVLRALSRSPTPRSGLSRTASNQGTSSAGSLGIAPMTPTASVAPLSPLTPVYDHARAPSSPDPSLGPPLIQIPLVNTPASETGSTGGMVREGAARLLFSDYFVKPIQRLCLYPVVLSTLLKYTDDEDPVHAALEDALATMRRVAEDVDEAGRERERVLMAALISSRVEATLSVTPTLIASLGHCLLSGTLDVMHHHSVLQPLAAPLRFKYFAVFVYEGFILFAKVRKPCVYEPKFWFPLWAATLYGGGDGFVSRLANEQTTPRGHVAAPLPYSCRLVCLGGHNFELVASSAREKDVWVSTLAQAIARAPFSPPRGGPSSFPSSLGDYSVASDDLRVTGLAEEHSDAFVDVDPLGTFLAEHAAAPSPAEIIVRHSPLSARAVVDRAMVFSDAIVAARAGAMKDRVELASATPSIGAAVGAAIGGLARAAARKAPRRGSTLFSEEEQRLTIESGGRVDSVSPPLVASPTKLDTQLAPTSTVATGSPTWKVRTARARPPLLSGAARHVSCSVESPVQASQGAVQAESKRSGSLARRKSFVDDRRASTSRPPSTRNNSSMTSLKNMWTSRSRTSSAEFDLNELTARAAAGVDAQAAGQYANDRNASQPTSFSDNEPTSPVELILTDAEEQHGSEEQLTFTSRASTLRGAFHLRRRQRSGSASSDFGPAPINGNVTPYNQSRSVVSSRESLNVPPSPHKLAARLAQSSRESLRRSFTLGSKGKQRAMSLPSVVGDDGRVQARNVTGLLSAESVASRESLSPVATTPDRSSGHTSPSLSADDGHARLPSPTRLTEELPASTDAQNAMTSNGDSSTMRASFLKGTLKSTRRLSTRFLGSRSTPPLSGLRSVAETTQEHAFGVIHPAEPTQTSAAVKLAHAPERERTTSTSTRRSASFHSSAAVVEEA